MASKRSRKERSPRLEINYDDVDALFTLVLEEPHRINAKLRARMREFLEKNMSPNRAS